MEQTWADLREIGKLTAWNNSMTGPRLRECSSEAQSWIRSMVMSNKDKIAQLKLAIKLATRVQS